MATPELSTWHADISMTSPRGPDYVDISMAFADVSVDSISIDWVNGSTGSTTSGPHVSLLLGLMGRTRRLVRLGKRERVAVHVALKMDRAGSAFLGPGQSSLLPFYFSHFSVFR